MKMTSAVRQEVALYIKNGLDISDIIKNYEVAGEDLSGSIIKSFDRPGENISRVNLHNAKIGEPDKTVNWNRIVAKNINLKGCQFLGKLNARKGDFEGSTFDGAYAPYVDYRYANMKGCTFCETVFTISTLKSYGAKFDNAFFRDLAKHWNVTITVNEDKPEIDGNNN